VSALLVSVVRTSAYSELSLSTAFLRGSRVRNCVCLLLGVGCGCCACLQLLLRLLELLVGYLQLLVGLLQLLRQRLDLLLLPRCTASFKACTSALTGLGCSPFSGLWPSALAAQYPMCRLKVEEVITN